MTRISLFKENGLFQGPHPQLPGQGQALPGGRSQWEAVTPNFVSHSSGSSRGVRCGAQAAASLGRELRVAPCRRTPGSSNSRHGQARPHPRPHPFSDSRGLGGGVQRSPPSPPPCLLPPCPSPPSLRWPLAGGPRGRFHSALELPYTFQPRGPCDVEPPPRGGGLDPRRSGFRVPEICHAPTELCLAPGGALA